MLAKKDFSTLGVNLTALFAVGTLGSGVTQAPQKVGSVATGDCESEYVLCALTLASTTSLSPGQVFQYDKDYNASLLTTATAVQGQSVGVGLVSQANVAAGAYYIWLQKNGRAPVACTTGSVANALCETTTTAGVVNFTNTPTTGTRKVSVASLAQASVAISATTVSGSTTLSALSVTAPNSLDDLSVGAALAGTGIPNGTTIAAINGAGSARTITMSAAATASGTAVAVTANGVLNANLVRPNIGTSN